MNRLTFFVVIGIGFLGALLFFASLLLDILFPGTQFSLGSLTHAKRDSNFGIFQQIGSAVGFLIALGSYLLYRGLKKRNSPKP